MGEKFDKETKLSKAMLETIEKMRKHGDFIRYDGGFWSWKDVEIKPLYNGGKFLCMVPIWHCDVKTLRALAKREIVTLNEEHKNCFLK